MDPFAVDQEYNRLLNDANHSNSSMSHIICNAKSNTNQLLSRNQNMNNIYHSNNNNTAHITSNSITNTRDNASSQLVVEIQSNRQMREMINLIRIVHYITTKQIHLAIMKIKSN